LGLISRQIYVITRLLIHPENETRPYFAILQAAVFAQNEGLRFCCNLVAIPVSVFQKLVKRYVFEKFSLPLGIVERIAAHQHYKPLGSGKSQTLGKDA
jgi:hypothetical protein